MSPAVTVSRREWADRQSFFDKLKVKAPFNANPHPSGRPDREIVDRREVIAGKISMNITIDQDVLCLPAMQAGVASRGSGGASLNQDERRVQHFHAWLDGRMAG